jgi:hypothetical protein
MATANPPTRFTQSSQLNRFPEDREINSAQMLRRHAQDLIETAERLLAQAEAELEAAYSMVSDANRSAADATR